MKKYLCVVLLLCSYIFGGYTYSSRWDLLPVLRIYSDMTTHPTANITLMTHNSDFMYNTPNQFIKYYFECGITEFGTWDICQDTLYLSTVLQYELSDDSDSYLDLDDDIIRPDKSVRVDTFGVKNNGESLMVISHSPNGHPKDYRLILTTEKSQPQY